MRSFKTALAAAALAGLALTAVAPVATAGATPAPAPATAAVGQDGGLTVDRTVVRRGEQLAIHVDHGPEALSWISSASFTRETEHPMGADEGVAHVVRDSGGSADAVATIGDVPPGQYVVHARVGGASVPGVTITVQ
ncbi:hypothetical protein EIL87_26545 [Saccharopolyspora rhizosphaerae]|uniref:Copper resistance protein CopC n=1 Tax=Saccharopolyspora rhizosphaerae TaxID=2492662 RepID=A0A3R8NZE6_9PSEU|nr:hypothetical protein [Saccharopolyspora rhizosphaerae]RRO13191.1 hypothetical protein EIL87_26545 [Saccharopolyspora rhizosphaerae]